MAVVWGHREYHRAISEDSRSLDYGSCIVGDTADTKRLENPLKTRHKYMLHVWNSRVVNMLFSNPGIHQ